MVGNMNHLADFIAVFALLIGGIANLKIQKNMNNKDYYTRLSGWVMLIMAVIVGCLKFLLPVLVS